MTRLKHIRRYRFDNETYEALKKLPNESQFVRLAVLEKLEKLNLIQIKKIV